MAQQKELKLTDYYYTKTAANNQFALKKYHYHDGQDGNADYRNYSILLSDNQSTTTVPNSRIQMTSFQNNRKLYASVKQNGKNVSQGWVTFIANGVRYSSKIGAEIANFAVLNINWNPAQTYQIYAMYVGDASGLTKDTTSYSYCMGYCLLDIVSPYKLTVLNTNNKGDFVKNYGDNSKHFQVKLTDKNNNPVSGKNIEFYINGVTYAYDNTTNTANFRTNSNGIAQKRIELPQGQYTMKVTYVEQSALLHEITTNVIVS